MSGDAFQRTAPRVRGSGGGPSTMPWAAGTCASNDAAATGSVDRRTTNAPSPVGVHCTSVHRHHRYAEYVAFAVRADQGVLAGLTTLDLAALNVDWLTVRGTDRDVPLPHPCGKYAPRPGRACAGCGRNPQHDNCERFVEAIHRSVATVSTEYATSLTVARVVRDFVAAPGSPTTSLNKSASSSSSGGESPATSSGRLTAQRPPRALGVFVGGHVDVQDGAMLCSGGGRFSATALAAALSQGVALQRHASAWSRSGGDEARPVMVCVGVCGNGREWADALCARGDCAVVVAAPLWAPTAPSFDIDPHIGHGGGATATLPPSMRKAYRQLFGSGTGRPLFMEAYVSLNGRLSECEDDSVFAGRRYFFESSSLGPLFTTAIGGRSESLAVPAPQCQGDRSLGVVLHKKHNDLAPLG